MSFYEEIKRVYSNGVKFFYVRIDEDNLYIHSIYSNHKQKGNATESLQEFINDFSKMNIYLYSSSELGTDKKILDSWYEKLGFVKISNQTHIPYNVTHCLKYMR